MSEFYLQDMPAAGDDAGDDMDMPGATGDESGDKTGDSDAAV